MPDVRHKRGTRAGLNALRNAGGLVPQQVYMIVDEGSRLAVATAVDAYQTYALVSELASNAPQLIVSNDAGGGNGYFQIFYEEFTTIEVKDVSLDNYNGWNNSTKEYRIPQTGLYDCSGKVRPGDNNRNINFGLGIDTSNKDSASFVWATFPQDASVDRFVLQNRVVRKFFEGDSVRLFGYNCDGINKAELVIVRIA